MITERAILKIDPSAAEAFEGAVRAARPLFLAHPDCHNVTLERGIESPDTYVLVVEWSSVAAHMDSFRASEGFARWRALAGPFFLSPPVVEHFARIL